MSQGLAIVALIFMLAGCSQQPAAVFPGYAEAEYVRLSSPLAGTLAKIYLKRGDQAAADAPAFVLEQESEHAQREEAESRVRQAQQQLVNLQRGRRPEELATLRAQLEQAQAALALSSANLARGARLVADKFSSPATLDQLRADVKRDQANVAEGRAQLALGNKGARANEIGAAQQELAARQATLQQAEWALTQKTRRTPTAGVVADVLFREGEWVPAGGAIVSLLPPQNIKARFFVPQSVLGALALGQNVSLSCDSCKAPIAAKISFIAPEAEYTAPIIYSKENRANLVFMVEARPGPAAAAQLHPGQPLEIRLVAPAGQP